MTYYKREIGCVPTWDEMADSLIRNFEQVLGALEPAELPQKVYDQMEILKLEFESNAWLFMKRKARDDRKIKIATNVNIVQRVHKAPGGLLKAVFELKENKISNLSLSGDFFCYPRKAIGDLESTLDGTDLSEISGLIDNFYKTAEIEIPGITLADWVKVLNS
jgi:lipoate-protein ligase A